MRRARFTPNDVHHAERIIESLARHRATAAASVLSLLRGQSEGGDEALREWLKPLIVRLAGEMRLESAVPVLVESLCGGSVSLADEATTALIKIGGDVVIRALADRWGDAPADFRAAAADVLEHVHTDLAAERCVQFFLDEKDTRTKLSLAQAVLSQFVAEGVEPVRQFVLGHPRAALPDVLDVRYRLVVACGIMGVRFAGFQQWYEEAVTNQWGLGDYKPPRLADSFPPE